ncbi:hypothetical protein PAXRUDRAFT_27853 [Paxillus rubicundulus Ve08.2h10]|uniref:Uncharacterized protein n=1 Tax=Paxillus rubicundulus Ve08.2h10 TaxID=930991 RepID=A0A0D0DIW1_9AGAM|nr:hypothetical protein PAXRUDRAFT_27853 [Paxillus rubicundulus Ve08.2h10]
MYLHVKLTQLATLFYDVWPATCNTICNIILNVHMESTLVAREEELLRFHKLLELARLNHISLVSELICSHINHLDDEQLKATLEQHALQDNETEILDDKPSMEHVYLGSAQKLTTFDQVEQANLSNWAFCDFRKKFTQFINGFAVAHNILLPQDQLWWTLQGHNKLQEFRYLKVNYESMVDWRMATDYL